MSRLPLLILGAFLAGCASRGQVLKEVVEGPTEKKILVPFFLQSAFHCAPAALWMVTQYLGMDVTIGRVTEMLYTPEQQGTFQNDLLAAVRRLGLLGLPLRKMETLVQEVGNGHPVLVFQNLGFPGAPIWHYALVVGYDLNEDYILLHTGSRENFPMGIRTFERLWERGENWGLLVVRPGTIPESASESELILASAALELVQRFDAARESFERILEKWPGSFGAHLGLGNYYYRKDDFHASVLHLRQATTANPDSPGVWHNLALALHEARDVIGARSAAEIALKRSSPAERRVYEKNLAEILRQSDGPIQDGH